MITERLKKLKEERGLTAKQISELSGIPESTVSRVLSGQTDNPGFDTVSALVKAMDGSLDAMTGIKQPEKVEASPIILMYEKMLADKNRTIRFLLLTCGILLAVFIFIVLFDVLNGNVGFVRYV